jgi:hypothetical protein
VGRSVRQERDPRLPGDRDERGVRRLDDVVPTEPERLDSSRDERARRFGDVGRGVGARLEELDAERRRLLAGDPDAGLGGGLGGAPDGADSLQLRPDPAREAEELPDRLEGPDADEVARVAERVAGFQADVRGERVGDGAEDVQQPALAIRVREHLEGGRRGRDREVVAASHDLAGDRVRRRRVPFGVEPLDLESRAFAVPGPGEALEDSTDGVVEDRPARELEDRDARERAHLRAALAQV